ncbi:response regulator transcription factor [Chitinophaga alhagiae]|nr:response regulator [Chitinophaga alhagiae]
MSSQLNKYWNKLFHADHLTPGPTNNPGVGKVQKQTMGALILIIDDEPDICHLLQLSLSKHGYKVKYVHALKEGMQFLKRQQPDILFLDIHLPDGSGLEALPAIKAQYPDLPVITISAYDNGMEKQKALTAGAARFLPKPFNVGELQDIIYEVKS